MIDNSSEAGRGLSPLVSFCLIVRDLILLAGNTVISLKREKLAFSPNLNAKLECKNVSVDSFNNFEIKNV